MALEPHTFLFSMQSQLLRSITETTAERFQGLAQAARQCRSLAVFHGKVTKKLVNIDFAFNCVRHISKPSVGAFTSEVERLLSMYAKSGNPTAVDSASAEPDCMSVVIADSKIGSHNMSRDDGDSCAAVCDEMDFALFSSLRLPLVTDFGALSLAFARLHDATGQCHDTFGMPASLVFVDDPAEFAFESFSDWQTDLSMMPTSTDLTNCFIDAMEKKRVLFEKPFISFDDFFTDYDEFFHETYLPDAMQSHIGMGARRPSPQQLVSDAVG
mmetsp:Transcript_115209/g.229489  ORF Transcript_115209/g.229489 Transcript_115209/m.229489 type:complete len:270 (+) Transcript_115209:69-878(+)|eukprot:CAMPEP_0172669344 /NCGR_PEP_ID=MMETSP1074-20121228/9618_1 /TAXON_ID=2916 /ORGANISM="Ceratium fusus, Strain PA161109" /LENGTH=269 /DNA_ID=CAMNT_0013486103 /DNA_START=35 /DNA_END=844 /DNA_ORIENTATION=+